MDMNVWICVIIAGLIAITAVLVVKIYLIKKSTREIRRSFGRKAYSGYEYSDPHI